MSKSSDTDSLQAQFIERAVNHHHELLGALKRLLQYCGGPCVSERTSGYAHTEESCSRCNAQTVITSVELG